MSEAAEPPFDVELHGAWTAEPSAVPRVRASVAAFAREAGASQGVVDDIRLAVSEAATNVVVHAYVGSAPGPLDVHARIQDRRMKVEIHDEGGGLRSRPDSPGLGIGLSLISALTESVMISSSETDANRVVMTFHLDAVRDRSA